MLLTLIIPSPIAELTPAAWRTLGLVLWMATWWVSEVIPIPATSLLPLVMVPFANIASLSSTAPSYAHPLIFLFLGGFLLSLAMEKWQLHKRIALRTMLLAGTSRSQQLLAMMLVTAFLSMWMSNTATSVMMLPIAMSIIAMTKANQANDDGVFAKAMLLGLAYAASIGGIATLIGTPPNALMAAYLAENYDLQVGFAQWMMLGLPLSCLLLLSAWLWLAHIHFNVNLGSSYSGKSLITAQLKELGPMTRAERTVLWVFLATALSWLLRPYLSQLSGLNISDTSIALIAALALFCLPANGKHDERILDWQTAQQVPWGVLLLFGGGLALAAQVQASGLADYIAALMQHMSHVELVIGIVLVTACITFLTEITSNSATAAGFLPLLGPVAVSFTGSPLSWVVPAALAASCAFMMPVATPPNAIVFGSGELRIGDMVKAGLFLNLVAILLITLVTVYLMPLIITVK
ncbi:SLC13 family permease [Motilimonas sp. KMU-193]|uniref:SLC13 family permease n=1 Tax=Motilimonas sp. KMU-193 TaxID=3388668 RepID=UPI00396B3098